MWTANGITLNTLNWIPDTNCTRFGCYNFPIPPLTWGRTYTRNPGPWTLDPGPWTLDPQPSTLNPQPLTLNPQPSTLHLKPETLDPNPPTRCGVCTWTDGEAMVAAVSDSVAGFCLLNMSSPGGGAVFTEALFFNGTDQVQGVALLEIAAGVPDAETSEIRVVVPLPGQVPSEMLNVTKPPFGGTASSEFAFDLAVILRDSG